MSDVSFIEKLLDGVEVEWKPLGEIAKYVRGLTYNKVNESSDGNGYKVLRANNITLSGNSLNFNDVKIVEFDTKVKHTQKLHKNDILISAASGSREHVGKVAFINSDMDYYFGGFMGVVRSLDEIKSRYLFHVLTSDIFQKYLNEMLNSSTINNLSSKIINSFIIPIPPLNIQIEIVRILDTFTTHTAELTAELTARKKQYNYYRNQLLTFEEGQVESKTLREIVKIQRGKRLVKSQLETIGNYAVYQNSMTPLGYYHERNVKSDTTFIISAGSAGEIGYSDFDFWAADDVYFFLTPDNIESKFLYYFLLTQKKNISSQVRRASIPRLSKTVVERLQIPIPPLNIQAEIITILDKFDALTHSITDGLPREIKLRQQQYEYYRDLLLSFPKSETTV